MPEISVIIPVYNREKTLARCLDSCLQQTFPDFEVICVNDASTDGTAGLLEQYAQKDNRIKVIMQEHAGEAAARNRALDQATGNYITFLDSDDYFHPQALEALYSVATRTKAPVTCAMNFVRITHPQPFENIDIKGIAYKIHQDTVHDLLSVRYLSSLLWNKLYQKEIFQNRRLIEGISNEDWPFITTLFSDIPFYASFDTPIYCYDDTHESVIRSHWTEKRIHDYVTAIYFVYRHYQQKDRLCYWPQVRHIRIRLSIKMILSKIIHSDNRKHLAEVFYPLYEKMRLEGIIRVSDFSLKSKWRLFRLFGLKGLK